ncbi:glycoside hydrolase family 3 C-terminal domain-containing protein [Dactylosporangium vinaceum]|uniref:beta-glucosidase n=1 Tax=Dactylosporangium vinaceum TaxID=53362 RepID=A0ABV5MBW9_9ACTN|nr:glycoside hydrolase family 3 N-terminal domain-containing protein [Dactylosporangium vinaceum]UAC01319.1 glycoside hydrolase family 3 C-terminal domain-containing protein [Dactylosporangium vinaceum]
MPRPVLLTAVTALSVAAATLVGVLPAAAAEPYLDPSLPVPQRVADLMSRMSLDEKIGQMTQAERASASAADVTQYRLGSILSGGGSAPSPNTASSWADMTDNLQRGALATPLKIPLVYGSDAVHGHNNVVGATLFPHNVGLGATRDPALVQQVGRVTADEVRGTGVNWTFSPCLCVARNDRWGRTYESFGEKPELPVSMATIIDGYQAGGVMATAKHYVGDGGTTGGVDQGDTQISEAELRAIHLPPFQEAIRRHVASVMVSFSSFNGQKLHGSDYLVNGVLKNELGFDGFVVSDWNGIDQIEGGQGFTASEVRRAVNAGIDMVMVPTAWKQFIDTLRAEVQAGRVTQARIDDAVRRILTKKFEFGLFEKPFADRTLTGTVGNAAHRTVARQAVRESQVLLKNTGVLPLAKSGKIFVAGKSADNIGLQSGGWTVSWQGAAGNTTPGTTILQGIRAAAGSATVTYNAAGSGIDSSYNVAVAVVGETPYAEGQGDRPSSLGLDTTDLNTLSTLKAAGVPVVVVLVSGRPLDIAAQLPDWSGLVAAWLPGTEGGGVADVLFGDYAPTGKLPMTWMQSASQEPINDGDGKPALFAYGFGLTYSTTPPPSSPGQPGTPVVSAVTSTSATLTWTAPTTGSTATSYRVYQGATLVATVTGTTYALTGLTPDTSTSYTVVGVDSAGRAGPASGAATVTTPPSTTTPPPSAGCAVTYSVNDWGGGFTGTVTVKNTGSTSINGWTLAFSFAGNQKVSQGWSATWSQSGAVVTAKSEGWNGTLAPGASQSAGFNATYSGSNPRPTAFTVNGAACTVA